jgi:hypothetical protein
MLDADMNVCYWSTRIGRCKRFEGWSVFFAALLAPGGCVAAWRLWGGLPLLWLLLSQAVWLLPKVAPVLWTGGGRPMMSGALRQWRVVLNRYEALWQSDSSLSSVAGCRGFRAAKRLEEAIDETELPPRSDRLVRWAQKHVLDKRGIYA